MANIDGLAEVYGKICMLTGIKVQLSYHHIIKREHGGDRSLDNGGLIYTGIHSWIHNELERKDKTLYIRANQDIRDYKQFYLESYNQEWFQEYRDELWQYYLEQMMNYYDNKKEDKVKRLIRRQYERQTSR